MSVLNGWVGVELGLNSHNGQNTVGSVCCVILEKFSVPASHPRKSSSQIVNVTPRVFTQHSQLCITGLFMPVSLLCPKRHRKSVFQQIHQRKILGKSTVSRTKTKSSFPSFVLRPEACHPSPPTAFLGGTA